ncbi:hypothetical protein HYV12_03430 [Candidatus Dojkabacteria bacterium]|nr:hypothetical protein [Candidatus Dojkabacteria bacterium]
MTYTILGFISIKVGRFAITAFVVLLCLFIQVGRLNYPNQIITTVDPYLSSKYLGYSGFGVFGDTSDLEVIAKLSSYDKGAILNVGYLDSLWTFLGSEDVLFRKGGVSNLDYIDLSPLQYSREILLDDIVDKYPTLKYLYIPFSTKVRIVYVTTQLKLRSNSNGDLLYEIISPK